jgi:hypothetical protein
MLRECFHLFIGRSPGGHGRGLDLHGNPVVGELQVVHAVVPFRHGFRRHGERVGSEDEAESLHPREVARAALRALADEVGVDVEVAVGDEAEVLVLAAVEVEHHTIASHDPRVSAHATDLLATRCGSIKTPRTTSSAHIQFHDRSLHFPTPRLHSS